MLWPVAVINMRRGINSDQWHGMVCLVVKRVGAGVPDGLSDSQHGWAASALVEVRLLALGIALHLHFLSAGA